MTIIARFKAAPEFTGLAESTRRAYLGYIKLIEDEFGDLPLAALADRRVRGEFKSWRDKFGNTPRKADFAWIVLARMLSFAKDRGIIAVNPCERGGRLYSGNRRDKIWSEEDIASLLSIAPKEIQLALMLAIWTGQRQGDLRLPWSAFDGTHIRFQQSKTGRRIVMPAGAPAESAAGPHRASRPCDPDQHDGAPMDRRRVQVVVGQALRSRRHRRPHVS
jgi:integrase